MPKSLKTLQFNSFEEALKTLQDAVKAPPKNDLERDGVIQRFEYTFEMAWKAIRSFLFAAGRAEVSNSPKPLLRDALEENLIHDIKTWFDFLEARNNSTHDYSRLKAEAVFRLAQAFPPYAEKLLSALKEKTKPTP